MGSWGEFRRLAALAALVALCATPTAVAADPSPDPAPDPPPVPAQTTPAAKPAPRRVVTPQTPAPVSSAPPVVVAPRVTSTPPAVTSRPQATPKPAARPAKRARQRVTHVPVSPSVVLLAPAAGPAVAGPDLVPASSVVARTLPQDDGGIGPLGSIALVLGGVLVALALVPPARTPVRPVVVLQHVRVPLFAVGCSVLCAALITRLLA